jgi:hypothetical protein
MVLVGIPDGKRPVGRPRHRCKDNIKIDFTEKYCDKNWIYLAHDSDRWRALVNTVINIRVP